MYEEGEFAKIGELISSDSYYSNYNHHHHHQHNHNYSRNENQQRPELCRQTESSLMRYRSAPSSFYASLLDEIGCDNDFLSPVGNLPPVSTTVYGGSSHQMPPINTNGSYTHINHNTTRSNLIRQSSTPAGFLSSLNAETGFAGTRDVEKTSSSSRSNNHISFSSMPSSSPSPFLPQIVENKNEVNDSKFKSLKRTRDGDSKMIPSSTALDIENGSSGHYSPSLVHHLSLPKTSSEMAVVEKFLRFEQDSTPCKIRAKRGCATHPRSIAERVRRTRISERMKKIQALFPVMDKQTSIADMLDLAVQYIKDLQKELKALNDARARCICSTQQ